jgi:hypothetical protein
MSDKTPKYKFPGDIDRSLIHSEQPLDPMLNHPMKMPNPLDPMGNIETEGRAMRNLASGRIPMWVLMTGWATIGLGSFLLLDLALQSLAIAFQQGKGGDRLGEFLLAIVAFAPMLLIAGLIITILFRATWRKR